MSVRQRILELRAVVSSDCEILNNPNDGSFQRYSERWTDIAREIPAAIVLPTTEADIQKVVQWGVGSGIPFVVKGAGGSEWSTIDDNGFVIDLQRYSSVTVDAQARTATVRGGITQKDVAVALAEERLFTALGNGNIVGVTGYALGGGSAITNSLTGFGSDQIISARLITSKGSLLDVTAEQHPDLLWALRGAGHFFGVVTELVIKAYPFSLLGTDDGTIWSGAFVFPLDRARELAGVMDALMADDRYATSGLMMIAAPPPAKKPSLVIAARHIGDPAKVQDAYRPLYDLKPLVVNGGQVPIQNASDGREAFTANGGFKRFGIVGLRRFDVDRFMQSVEVWKELVDECPDALSTSFNFQWDARPVKFPEFESAMCLHDTRYWQNNFIWHTNPENRGKVDEYNERCISIARGPNADEWADYQNGTRIGPIERRFRGKDRLARLRRLKREWDPTGVFTRQLLE